MDNALIFLGIALLIAVIGGAVVMLLHRDPDASADGVEEFQRIMSALAPDDEPARRDAVPSEGSGDGA